jgi:hypothetical protein
VVYAGVAGAPSARSAALRWLLPVAVVAPRGAVRGAIDRLLGL